MENRWLVRRHAMLSAKSPTENQRGLARIFSSPRPEMGLSPTCPRFSERLPIRVGLDRLRPIYHLATMTLLKSIPRPAMSQPNGVAAVRTPCFALEKRQ